MKKPMSVLQTKRNQEGKDGQNRELSLETLEAKKDNLPTDEIIVSSASESTEEEPIFHNFLPIPVNHQENVFETKTHTESEEVSTDLKLGCGSYITQKGTANENLANSSLPATSSGNKRMKIDGHQVEKGEGSIGFDPWLIKKRITDSEIRGRLRLPAVGVKEHILPNWDKECVDSIKIGERFAVTVWDCDTESKHQLFFNKETGTNATYGFIGQWTEEFVSRRGLKKDDEIGLYWDRINKRFCFSILNRASSD